MAYDNCLPLFLLLLIILSSMSGSTIQAEARHLLETTPLDVPKPELPLSQIPTIPKPELPTLQKLEIPIVSKLEIPKVPKPEISTLPKPEILTDTTKNCTC